MHKDSLVIAFRKIEMKHQKGLEDDEFSFHDVNSKLIHENEKYCKTFAQEVALYDSVGFKNAKEYLTLTTEEFILQRKILVKYHSEIFKFPVSEQHEIINSIYPNFSQ